MATKEEHLQRLKLLLTKGRLSPKLKTATAGLITALKNNNQKKINEFSYLHQEISSGWGMDKEYPYNEDDNHNMKVAGTTAYSEFDIIWHGVG